MPEDPFEQEAFSQSKPMNILVVDDDPAVLRLLLHFLKEDGYVARSAKNGEEALERILQDCPDVVITDWEMPKMDGLELTKQVRQLYRQKVLPHYVYILLLTAHSGKERLIEGLESGIDDFVTKSTELGEMQVELRARLKAASRIRFLKRDLEKAARTDPLTGLFHRTTFFQRATLEWDRSERTGYPLSVVMFDCDFFKRVNDRHGHAAGDEVLRELVARVRKGCRKEDVFCRYGGEEFCVLLPRMNEKEAKQWAERIRKTVASEAIRIAPTEELTVTASFGVAQKTDALLDIDQLVAQADQALLAAKELGRNRTVCYTETIAEEHPLKQAIGVEEAIFARMTAREVMSPIFHSINKDESVASVVDFFLQTRFGALPVVNEDGSLFGIISERNFLGMVGEEHRWHQSIQDLVNQYVISFPDETPIRGIIEFLGRVPLQEVVIVENNRPIGMISRNLLLRWRWNRWLASLTSYREKCSRGDGKAGVLQEVREKIKFLTSDLENLKNNINSKKPESEGLIITYLTRMHELSDQIIGFYKDDADREDPLNPEG